MLFVNPFMKQPKNKIRNDPPVEYDDLLRNYYPFKFYSILIGYWCACPDCRAGFILNPKDDVEDITLVDPEAEFSWCPTCGGRGHLDIFNVRIENTFRRLPRHRRSALWYMLVTLGLMHVFHRTVLRPNIKVFNACIRRWITSIFRCEDIDWFKYVK